MHWPDPQTPIEETAQAMADLHQAGKVPGMCKVEDELDYSFKPLTTTEISRLCESYGGVRNGRPVRLQAA